ncbi:hypothetical protein DQ04_06751020 [Trypanosoma grayi]|uniref:hypothetical protein n=1 Tax=Trypanosoma grayi TaxID=71804 RepID=UPI0004F42ECC|nr:hypothetical protein DQ04_06751020 [Trypanosoma grayi]KEG08636.1 hypothetical protein DQ04_06751020 [Trypanosoma grayi]
MPPKKGKGRRKKKVDVLIDPDEPFRQSLDAAFYVAKPRREGIDAAYMQQIDTAIRAFTVAQPPVEAATVEAQEKLILEETATSVPITAVPYIVRALGFNPTGEQMRQIAFLVLCDMTQASVSTTESTPSATEGSQAVSEPRREMERSEMVESCLSMMSVTATYLEGKALGLMADRRKLEAVLLDMLHTGLLVYDMTKIDSKSVVPVPARRVASVVERGDPERVDEVFDTIWWATRQLQRDDGTRYIDVAELQRLMEVATASTRSEEPAFTAEELETFLYFVHDGRGESVGEDTFALTALYGG